MTNAVRLGWLLSGLTVLVLLADAVVGLLAPGKLAGSLAETGYDATLVAPISIIALVCALVYALPRTAVLGAILVTGFCAAAIATHVRIGEVASPPQLVCLAIAVAAWAGLWLRLAALRAVLPLTR